VSGNKVLRRIFGPRREVGLSVELKKLRNERLQNKYSSSYIFRTIKSRNINLRDITRIAEMRNAYEILVGKPDGKRPCGRLTISVKKCVFYYH
jgi:hypothetical protein